MTRDIPAHFLSPSLSPPGAFFVARGWPSERPESKLVILAGLRAARAWLAAPPKRLLALASYFWERAARA